MRGVLNERFANPPLDGDDNVSAYRRHTFRTPAGNTGTYIDNWKPRQYVVSGDCIFISRIQGPGIIQIKLGDNNPWITVAAGMKIHRAFTKFWVRDALHYATKALPDTYVEIYTAFGDFVDRPAKTHVLAPSPYWGTANCVVGAWKYLHEIIDPNGAMAGSLDGQSFCIKSSPTNTEVIRVKFDWLIGTWGAPFKGYKLYPGESISGELSGRFDRVFGEDGYKEYGLCICSESATAAPEFSYVLGYGADMSDPNFLGGLGVAFIGAPKPPPLAME